MLIGGSVTLSYQLIFDFLRHHEETNNDRPIYFDHLAACTIISSFSIGMWGFMPRFWAIGAVSGFTWIGPGTWWILKNGKLNASVRPSNIYYENSVTREEVERFQHLDAIESLGSHMQAQPGYGYFKGDSRHV